MNNTNDIIDQIEVHLDAAKLLIPKLVKNYFETDNIIEFHNAIKEAFTALKLAEYDNRSNEEAERDAKEARCCDKYHENKDNN